MNPFPPLPDLSNAPDGLFRGHLWLLEAVDGAPVRFQVHESGYLRFGDETQVYDDTEALPAAYRQTVRHIRDDLDREALREAVESVEDIVFFGTATIRQTVPYDFDQLPPFLGTDVFSSETGRFRPPDAVDGIFRQLGLSPVNAIEQELPARDFSPDKYPVPESAWYDGPAAGIVIRNKRDQRARLSYPAAAEKPNSVSATGRSWDTQTADKLAAQYVTPSRLTTVSSNLTDKNQPVTVEVVTKRLVEQALRDSHHHLCGDDPAVELSGFRSAVASLVHERLSS